MDDDTRSRRGPFWDVLAGRAAPPPAAETLGWELLHVDPEQGVIEVAFLAGERFTNPMGVVQGGFLAAMLDDTLGPALVATLPDGHFAPTLDLHVQFLRPARPGRLVGRGRVVRRGRQICFMSGELLGPDGEPVAVATATAQIQTADGRQAGSRPR
ncbi:PaaI family thioesterase [Nonomuraea wenchangensis]|uniref:PaaI family thioesterase n=1 Tax=Nonomuraea wenchangensis TaxID=568860 RepID=UPI00332AA7F0